MDEEETSIQRLKYKRQACVHKAPKQTLDSC